MFNLFKNNKGCKYKLKFLIVFQTLKCFLPYLKINQWGNKNITSCTYGLKNKFSEHFTNFSIKPLLLFILVFMFK